MSKNVIYFTTILVVSSDNWTLLLHNSTTSAWALGGGAGSEVRMRNFAEIIAEEKKQRNILEIHLVKKAATVENETFRPKSLTFDDLGELLFDVLNVDPSQCIGFNYSTGRYDTREVKFKPGVDQV